MKKKEKPKQKEKEFSVSPFRGLKGALGLGEQKAKAPEAPKAVAKTPQQMEDERLFLDAMSGVQPKGQAPQAAKKAAKTQEVDEDLVFLEAMMDVQRLKPVKATPAREKAEVAEEAVARAKREEEEERVFLKAVEALKMDVRFTEELGEEETPQRRAVNRLRQLRRGAIRVDFELDLHGLTKDEAIDNLGPFIRGAFNRGQKGVLVITGKGNNSPGEPVLKAAVDRWLRENGKGMVSEFVQAPKEMGGSGAVVVFLKEKKVEEEGEK